MSLTLDRVAEADALALRVAAVAYGPGEDVDAPMMELALTLASRGVAVAGMVQHFGPRISDQKRQMLATMFPSREVIRLDEARGGGVQGCILDPSALARAAGLLRTAIERRPAIVLAGRFGKEEVSGGGVRVEIAEALAGGIAVIAGVRHTLLPAWREFLGCKGAVLPPQASALVTWAEAALR